MVALSNGCICCTLREDLFVEIAKLASKPDGLDHILIESSGISEPLPVAETFTFKVSTTHCHSFKPPSRSASRRPSPLK